MWKDTLVKFVGQGHEVKKCSLGRSITFLCIDLPKRKTQEYDLGCFQRRCDFIVLRAHALYSTVDDSSDELKSGPTRKKKDHSAFLLFFIFFFLTSQKTPRRDPSTIEYSGLATYITKFNGYGQIIDEWQELLF